MSKRSGNGTFQEFERRPRDLYQTPHEGVLPLLAHLPRGATFIEPCAGDGRLVNHLARYGMRCLYACDIAPQPSGRVKIDQRDVLQPPLLPDDHQPLPQADYIITNPPWTRALLHPMIERFRREATTWLLFDAGWMFTGQARPFLPFCDLIVNVGRLSWMGNDIDGTDDCCWYRFGTHEGATTFVS